MAIAKVIEVIAEGKSIDDAMKNAVKDASKTIQNIKSVYIENITGQVDGNKIEKVRVNAKITFVID